MNKHINEFIKVLENIDFGKNSYEVFTDWLEMSCMSFANVRYFNQNEELNERYKKVASKYNDEQIVKHAKLLAITMKALEEEMQDFLGEVYMCAGFGSSNLGQFFTPYSVCRVCAETLIPSDFSKDRILTLAEPCVGGGAMVIAMAEEMLLKGLNYQNNLYVEARDLSFNSVCMAMIQFSLLGIPATVVHGNTISLETFGVYETPMVGFNLIQERLKAQKRHDAEEKVETPVIELPKAEVKEVPVKERVYIQQEFDF